MKRIRVGVIGAGYLGRFHAEKYAALDSAELVGVVDIDRKRADTLAAAVETQAFSSHTDILDKVDAVSVVTPTETHFDITRELLARGIDVMLEKPMTSTVDEADELIETAERCGALLQIGHLERFNAAVVALEGKDVAPLFIESDRLSPFPNRGVDVDVILDLMIHDIDIILNLVDSDVESVEAVGVPVVTGKVDIANARLKFKSGCVANVTASRVSKEMVRKTRLFQPDEYVSIDYAAQKIAIFRRERGAGGLPRIVEEDITIERRDSLMEETRAFLTCVERREQPLVSGREGKRALLVAQQIQDSIQQSLEAVGARLGII
ncbi:MAG: Gfo/Idh/MocA family protein [Thermodesulfobacteriota bacterium]